MFLLPVNFGISQAAKKDNTVYQAFHLLGILGLRWAIVALLMIGEMYV